MTEYRLSPAGVLAKRDATRSAGWMVPHWVVVDRPCGDRTHWVGQELPDAAVETWQVMRAETVAPQAKDPVSG